MVALSAETAVLVHGVALYGSEEELVQTLVPFCEAGLEAGEPTIVRLGPHHADLLRSELRDPGEVRFVEGEEHYRHPPGALASARDLVGGHGGTSTVRMVGELPPWTALSLDAWIRYEAAVNRFLADLPIHALCAYDTRTTPDTVQAELLRTHHVVATPGGGQAPSRRFEPPEAVLTDRVHIGRDPLEDAPPTAELVDPTPARARHVVTTLADESGLDPDTTNDLLVGVSEVLTNALLHGVEPILVRMWAAPGRVVVAVRDAGKGPDDPFAGLGPVEPGVHERGLGLWITHQLCPEASLSSTVEGFTVRLGAGAGRAPGR